MMTTERFAADYNDPKKDYHYRELFELKRFK